MRTSKTSLLIVLSFTLFCLFPACQKREGKLLIQEPDLLNRDDGWHLISIDGQTNFNRDTIIMVLNKRALSITSIKLLNGKHELKLVSFYQDTIITTIELEDSLFFKEWESYYKLTGMNHHFRPYSMDTVTSLIKRNFTKQNKLFIKKYYGGCFGSHEETRIYELSDTDSIKILSNTTRSNNPKVYSFFVGQKPKNYLDSLITFELKLYADTIAGCASTSSYHYTFKCGKEITFTRGFFSCGDDEDFLP